MQSGHSTRRRVKPSEEGYVILFAMFLMALLVISLAIAAPQVAKSLQRDRDLETFHRGMQYRRAVQLYYRKFHAYPPNADALKETNNIRFLRKEYIDPITGKVDWKPILFGQNKVPVAMGFFGQPLNGGTTTIAGIGPSGGNGVSGSGGSLPGGISDIFGGPTTGSTSTNNPSGGGTGTSGGTGDSGATGGSTGSPTTTTSGTAATGGAGSTTGSTTGSGQSGLNGQTFGGGGIIGFEPVSPRQSILVYKKKDHYNEWEFTYDPISDTKVMTGGNAGAGGLPGSSTTLPVGSPTSGPTNPSPTTGPTTSPGSNPPTPQQQ
jgi:type II secretory pathway pseudopilin PulG